jgi:putative PIN family toxin of toxin-antitoxin system
MIFILDTNVLISAALGDGTCRNTFEVAQQKGKLMRSEETFIELVKTLEKPRLQKYFRNEDKIDFLANFLQVTQAITITEKINVCRDPKDNMFLELAVSCIADALITRDGDLLSLHPFRGIPIITVTNFIRLFN